MLVMADRAPDQVVILLPRTLNRCSEVRVPVTLKLVSWLKWAESSTSEVGSAGRAPVNLLSWRRTCFSAVNPFSAGMVPVKPFPTPLSNLKLLPSSRVSRGA